MNSIDFLYSQIYHGALRAGATERAALDAATTGVGEYKKNRFKRIDHLITEKIKQAKNRIYA